jgi:hypothetical protein
MIEIAIKVTGDDQALTRKFLIHEEGMILSHNDPVLSKMVTETIEAFKGNVDDVLIKIRYTW